MFGDLYTSPCGRLAPLGKSQRELISTWKFSGDAPGTGEPVCGGFALVWAGTDVLVKSILMEKHTYREQ